MGFHFYFYSDWMASENPANKYKELRPWIAVLSLRLVVRMLNADAKMSCGFGLDERVGETSEDYWSTYGFHARK